MVSNREDTVSSTWEELGTISNEFEPPHRIRLECGYKFWTDRVFCMLMKVIPRGIEMKEERVRQGLFEPAWGPYRNVHFLVPKKNGMHCFIISTMTTNRHTLEDTRILANVEEFSEVFTGLPIPSLTDFLSGYDQNLLHKESQEYMAFQTTLGIDRPTKLLQEATNSVLAFVRVSQNMPNAHLGSITEIFIDDVREKGPKSQYMEEEVEGLPRV